MMNEMLQAGLFQLVALQMGQITMHRIPSQLVLSQPTRTLKGFSFGKKAAPMYPATYKSIVFILESDMFQTGELNWNKTNEQ